MQATTTWGVATYTCNPYVIGRGNRAKILNRFISQLQSQGATFMTTEEAALEFNTRVPFSADSGLSKAS